MDKIIDLEIKKKMRLSISDLLENEWKFTIDGLENMSNELENRSKMELVKK